MRAIVQAGSPLPLAISRIFVVVWLLRWTLVTKARAISRFRDISWAEPSCEWQHRPELHSRRSNSNLLWICRVLVAVITHPPGSTDVSDQLLTPFQT